MSEQMKKTGRGCLLLTLIILGVSGGVPAYPQNTAPPAPSEALSASQVIQFLNRTIKWYRHLSAEQRIASEPDDQIVVYNNRRVADQVVRLSFDFARAESEILAKQAASNPSQNSGGTPERFQALRGMEEKINKTVNDTQAELDSNRQKLATATGRRRQELASGISELQAELDLAKARREAVHSMVEFVSGASSNGLGATGLRAQIEALAASIPAAALNPPTGRQAASASQNPVPAAGANATYSGPDVSGIWDLSDDIFSQSSHIRTIDSLIAQTDALAKAAKDLRAPLTTRLRELFRTSDGLAAQADSATPAQLDLAKKQLDGLATQFKQITSASMPLSKQSVLLTMYLRSLTTWREAVDGRRTADWRNLGVRLGFLALVLGIVFISAEVWRRAVYRYVQEPRQRHQFLLLRRFVLWLVIALIFAFTLAGRLSSIVTFAGLLTAGVAVALQSVILSIVGYFFLIGKFGIRVGDRVQIGSVTGEVIEIGLVRLHLMELGSGGFGAPTGRVVAFSNSIVFQPSSGLFKQISGTNFNWHEVRLALPRTANLASIKEKLLKAVDGVLADYSKELELQYREMKRTVQSVAVDGLSPKIQLRILPASVEAVIRFPVSFRNESEIDERVSQALLKAVESDPLLRSPGADAPAVHLRTDLSTADAAG
ncbi:MAG TPA: mechanosensitive ion channel domain-containing protein [Terriglobia bacterium]|nr:mechanosensitive ion channel domain-containing protein [Terriglobia bacterium]